MNKLYSLLAVLGIAVLIGAGCSQATTEEETTVSPEPSTTGVESTVTVSDEAADSEEEEEAAEESEAAAEETSEETVEEAPAEAATDSSSYTLDEIASHDSASDCWMALDGMVYDVTNFVSDHPGGAAILRGCGTDATDLFNAQGHSAAADAVKADYEIGTLAQ